MKVNRTGYINSGSNTPSSHTEESKPVHNEVTTPRNDSSESRCAFGRAAVNMQNPKAGAAEGDLFALLNSIAQEQGYTVYRFFEKNADGICARAKAGDAISGWKNLYNEKLDIACYRNNNGELNAIYTLDSNTKEVNVYDKNGELIKTYTPEEMKSLFEYKYHPESLHGYLRHNRYRSLMSEENLWNVINTIDNCFNSENKTGRIEKPAVVYRALQDNLTDSEKAILSTVGAVYRDNSFVSTTQNLDTAKRFNISGNPIMEITLPEGSKYLDLDRLFNIDRQRWREQEFLLKRGSEFIITGYDRENNIIKASYLNK